MKRKNIKRETLMRREYRVFEIDPIAAAENERNQSPEHLLLPHTKHKQKCAVHVNRPFDIGLLRSFSAFDIS